jgi:predicted  nucleic acid-binding Zn-ribbon protein
LILKYAHCKMNGTKMSIAKQLYQLQELDLEIDSQEQALSQTMSQLGESPAVLRVQGRLQSEQQHFEELKRKQQSAEWEIEDISTKLAPAEKKLFSGDIKNPKELSNLQHEVEVLKTKRNQMEEKTLEIMEQAEICETSVTKINSELETLKAQWQRQQQELLDSVERLKAILSDLRGKRQLLSEEISPQAVELYQGLRKERGTAVARVEQGICRGCRISLPITELQQARSGNLVKCSSCGRILFLA